MNQSEILKRVAENAHEEIAAKHKRSKCRNKSQIAIALDLAARPENDLERVKIGQNLIPFLRQGENIDTGALRILAATITEHISDFRNPPMKPTR